MELRPIITKTAKIMRAFHSSRISVTKARRELLWLGHDPRVVDAYLLKIMRETTDFGQDFNPTKTK